MTLPSEMDVVVVGAGPAGLAVAACLQYNGIPHLLLEKESTIAPMWHKHYDRLHLHTNRSLSGLPHFPMPRSLPKYPSRQQVIDYFESYAEANQLTPFLNVSVDCIQRENGRWLTISSAGRVSSHSVVIATGYSSQPVVPQWPGQETFPGTIVHSSGYQNGAPFAGQDVLVVGFGNSGGEIALDLAEHGARPNISVRSPVNIIPKEVLGLPILAIAIPLSKLPPWLADALSWLLLKAYFPSYRRLGLKKAAGGPFTQIARKHRIPLIDVGTVREIRRGRIQVMAEVQSFAGSQVQFVDGTKREYQAVVLATGFQPALPPILPTNITLPNEVFATGKGAVKTNLQGLYVCGFFVSPTGMLREVGMEAEKIATLISQESKSIRAW